MGHASGELLPWSAGAVSGVRKGSRIRRGAGALPAALLVLAFGLAPAAVADSVPVNLLRNAGFETVPNGSTGQNLMPTDWRAYNSTPDTYSDDRGPFYGLAPGEFGNFPGVTAQEGIRWVAGWTETSEVFGQRLTATLTPGQTYEISGYLHQAIRRDLNNPGSYTVRLQTNTGSIFGDVGTFTPTVSPSQGWVFRSFTFVAPANANLLTDLTFVPARAGPGEAYAGLDNLRLAPVSGPTAVPLPAAAWTGLALLGGIGVIRLRRGRHSTRA